MENQGDGEMAEDYHLEGEGQLQNEGQPQNEEQVVVVNRARKNKSESLDELLTEEEIAALKPLFKAKKAPCVHCYKQKKKTDTFTHSTMDAHNIAQHGRFALKCNICRNGAGSQASLRIHKGSFHNYKKRKL